MIGGVHGSEMNLDGDLLRKEILLFTIDEFSDFVVVPGSVRKIILSFSAGKHLLWRNLHTSSADILLAFDKTKQVVLSFLKTSTELYYFLRRGYLS